MNAAQLNNRLPTLFDRWSVEACDQVRLLGENDDNMLHLEGFLCGKPLPADPDIVARAAGLVAINDLLLSLFPSNPEIVTGWVKMPNQAFFGQTPLHVMLQVGLPGILEVRNYLASATQR